MMPLPITRSGDSLTILTSAGPRLTKVWDSAIGKPLGYEKAQQVSVAERFVSGIYELSALLRELEPERNTCVIRGKFIGHSKAREQYPAEIEASLKKGKPLTAPREGFTLRRLNFFNPQPLHFFYIDIDKFVPVGVDPVLEPEAAIAQYVAKSLPECFQGITYHWQLSSGAGHPDNAGVLKAHVAFWLREATAGEDLEMWVKAKGLDIDVTVFRTVQPNYTAAPVFTNGVEDPVPRRSGLCEGFLGDEVALAIDPLLLLRARTERKKRQEMVDPRDKENDVGLFCRTFEIEQVVERWLPDVFEFVNEWRMTWLQASSGAAEGAGVCDNRQGIFNTHSSDPLGGKATNKWDLVRHYKFGHLDAEMDAAERMLLGIGSWPSNVAMREMVKALPEMRVEAIKSSDTHHEAITAAADEPALRAVAQRIAVDGSIDRVAKDMLAGALRLRFGELVGTKPNIASIRGLIGMNKTRGNTSDSGPDWVQGWCYVTSMAKFFNLTSKELITRDAFDAAYCRHMPPDENGNVASAAKVACDDWRVPTVYNLMYLPNMGDLFSVDGKEYANLYRPESVPSAGDDAHGVDVLKRHVEILIPNPIYRQQFMQWASWIVRNPGHKVLWAVFIKGVEGDGKSVLGNMLSQAMGAENVGIISPETLAGSNFNDWAVGRCMNVIEELKMQGHNRHDVYNKIKPLITNPRIEVHGKGKASMTAMNTVNYIGFSNHIDALPLDDKDRRQFVLFTPFKDIGGLHAKIKSLGLTVEAYWDQLWDVVKHRPDVVRGFFNQTDISEFNPHSRAPDTEFKDLVVSMGDETEFYAKDLIENGAVGVGREVISSACLSKELKARDIEVYTSSIHKMLVSFGFAPFGKVIKWNGAAHRVWVTSAQVTSLTPEQIRVLLDATLADPGLDFLN